MWYSLSNGTPPDKEKFVFEDGEMPINRKVQKNQNQERTQTNETAQAVLSEDNADGLDK
jgi:hypothetical protein